MAIAFDAATDNSQVTGTSHSFSHTCTGDDRLLIVSWMQTVNATVTSCTYNGVAMTAVTGSGLEIVETGGWLQQYYLVAPATGSNTVEITVPTSRFMRACSASYTGVAQTGTIDSSNTATGTSDTATLTTTVVASDCWLIGTFRCDSNGFDGGGSSTLRASLVVNAGESNNLGDSNATVATGSQSLTAPIGVSVGWSGIISSIAPAGAVQAPHWNMVYI